MKKVLKAFTLIELIIVMAIMAILMTMVGLMFRPLADLFADTTTYNQDRYVMDGMNNVIQENLKYADKVMILYDYDGLNVPNVVSNMASMNCIPEAKINCLSIINTDDSANNTGSHLRTDFTDFNGNYSSGRIYKSTCLDGVNRVEWLIGGEAFYGRTNKYFVNIELANQTDLLSAGDFKYTIYAFDKNAMDRLPAASCSYHTDDGQKSVFANINHLSRAAIMSSSAGPDIANYVEGGVRFANNPRTDFMGSIDPSTGFTVGYKCPIDGDNGADSTQSSLGTFPDNGGYNIYIFYTVPE